MTYEIRNSLGIQLISKTKFVYNTPIDVSKLIPGIYILILQNNKDKLAKQFVKM